MEFTNAQKLDISNKYLVDKKTIKELSLEYNVSITPIKNIFRELNIITRPPEETSRKYIIDETYFDDINSEDKAYFLGLLFADGYNDERRRSVCLALVTKDRHILERFAQCLKSTNPIIDSKNKIPTYSDTSNFTFYNRHLSGRLVQLGCMQAKSFKITFPTYLREDLIRHFIRGYFDGDGCFSWGLNKKDNYFGNALRAIVNFTSTIDFCTYLTNYFKDKFDINTYTSCRNPQNNNNNRTITISGNKQVIKVMEWMYKDSSLYLERKHNKFLEFCKTREERGVIVSKLRSDTYKKIASATNITKHNNLVIPNELPRIC